MTNFIAPSSGGLPLLYSETLDTTQEIWDIDFDFTPFETIRILLRGRLLGNSVTGISNPKLYFFDSNPTAIYCVIGSMKWITTAVTSTLYPNGYNFATIAMDSGVSDVSEFVLDILMYPTVHLSDGKWIEGSSNSWHGNQTNSNSMYGHFLQGIMFDSSDWQRVTFDCESGTVDISSGSTIEIYGR